MTVTCHWKPENAEEFMGTDKVEETEIRMGAETLAITRSRYLLLFSFRNSQ
jgi:hypothetical protein